jgi:ElaB/YqjD/DUF883 family membrane-anchored ribosome-binding protein
MSTTSNDFAKHGQAWADNAADKVQDSIRDAQKTANEPGEKLSKKVEAARSQAVTSIKKVADQTRAVVRQGMEAANTATKQVRDTAMHASDSLVAFTKENPIKTILVAAASGALLLALFNVLARSRD